MKPRRITIKFFCEADSQADLSAAIPVFHRMIQEKSVEGLLIDVADYAHVPEGPGVILIGHEVEYALDLGDGGPGLLTTSKRLEDTALSDSLPLTLRRALVALEALEAAPSIGARFFSGRFEVRILDRIEANNDEASCDALAAAARELLEAVAPGSQITTTRRQADDPRQAVSLEVGVAPALDVAAVIEALGGKQVAGAATAEGWNIPVEELVRLRKVGASFELLDVREPQEFETVNLGGRLIPLGELGERLGELDPAGHVVVHCKVGGRGAKATQILRDAGFANAWNLEGGIDAWIEKVDPSLGSD